MSTLRHRISKLFAPSEDSGADSGTSTRAIFGSDSSTRSRESADSGYRSTPASTLEDLLSKVEPAVDASPRTLKKAASTTFQAFSNSLRSRTQSFYATSTGSPPRSGRKTPDKLDESFETRSPSRKRIGRSPRSSLGDTFSDSSQEKPRISNTQPTVGSPKVANSSSPLWASIKKRAGNSPHSNKAAAQGQTETPSSPIASVEPNAPSLDVEIPDHMLSVSQHFQRHNSRIVQPSLPESPSKAINHSPTDGQTQSRPELRTPPIGRKSVKGASNHLSLLPLFQTTSAGRLPANEHDGTKSNGGQHIRFLPLNTPLRIPLPPSPSEKTSSPISSLDSTPPKTWRSSEEQVTPAQPRSLTIRRGRSLQRGLNHLSNKHEYQENHPLFSAEDFDFDSVYSGQSPIFDQGSMPTTPERPNMGPRSAMDRARADRKDRYLALLDQDPETASDTETDPDLNLIPSPARNSEHSLRKSTTAVTDDSSQNLDYPSEKFRFAVEAIERTSGTVYDQSDPSSTENLHQVPTLLSGDLPYMVEAIERMPLPSPVQKVSSPELKDVEMISASSSDLLEGPSDGNPNIIQIPRDTLDDTGGTSLAHIVQVMRESKGSSESTVAAESDALLGVGQDRMQNKVNKIKTPISERNVTKTNQVKALGLPSPSSSSYSSFTDESCALTTHDPLCYTPVPWPTVHCRTSLSPDRANSEHTAQSSSSDDGNEDEKGTKLESQIDEYNRSPWSNLLFENDIKDTTEPLPPKDSGLSEITLPASTFLRLDSSELPLLRRKDGSEMRHTASQRGRNRSVTSDLDEAALLRKFNHSPESMERPFNAARLPAFGETLPQLTYSPPRGRKVPNKAKRPVRYRQALADIPGNADKAYTYSQIVKGDKKVDQLRRSLEKIGSLEEDVPIGKGVSWAKEDELIGYADPQTPISRRMKPDSLDGTFAVGHDRVSGVETSIKEHAAFKWKPYLEQDFRVSHYIAMNASVDTLNDSFLKMLDQQSQLSKLEERKAPEMTRSACKIFRNLFKGDGVDTEMEGALYDIRVVSPWNSSEKKTVAKHLMSVVYDLEELGVKAGLEEDGDESEEKGEE